MTFPSPTGWVDQQSFGATPPPEVLAMLGGSFDSSRWQWDPYTSRLIDRTTGGSYDYSGLVASQNPTQLVTDLSAYNASGGQQGSVALPVGSTPYFGFGDSASGYNAGLMPGSGTFVSTNPNEIADYRSHANDVVGRGVASVGALVGGAAALGGALGGNAATGAAAADGLSPITVGASSLPGGVPAINAAAFSGAGAIPAVASLPSAIATPAAINAFTGGAGAAANALGGAGDAAGGVTNALTGLERWLPYVAGGINTLLGANAADSAADAEIAAMREAIAEQRRQYDTTRADFEPWMAAGRDALGQLADPQNNFLASPGYEFARNEGTRGIENSFAARGGARSGNALRALGEYTTGLAQQDYGNWWNQQSGRAGLGQTATSNVAQVGANSSGQVSNYIANSGAARGAGIYGRNASLAGGINDAVSNWLYRRRTA